MQYEIYIGLYIRKQEFKSVECRLPFFQINFRIFAAKLECHYIGKCYSAMEVKFESFDISFRGLKSETSMKQYIIFVRARIFSGA